MNANRVINEWPDASHDARTRSKANTAIILKMCDVSLAKNAIHPEAVKPARVVVKGQKAA